MITKIYEEKNGVFGSLRMTLQLNREYKLMSITRECTD
ncbi:transposase [Clostridioides sp. ES-S-0006-03]|nr:transposase [Clostridioides sp. ES-S-0006-03]UDN62265.1 transposase [Clostridioides sp. ES-W-0016-02]